MVMLLAGCGGGGDNGRTVALPSGLVPAPVATADSGTDTEPLLDELTVILSEELQKLGRDPSASQFRAPSGSGNGILYVTGWQRRTGEGPDYDYSVTLQAHEELYGDYDGNGQVNAADLVMIARYWQQEAYYYVPEQSDTGQALPGGGASYADGNRDGIVNASDITVIAQHWMERLDGFRIFRSVDGGPEQLLLDHTDPLSGLSIARRDDYDFLFDPFHPEDFKPEPGYVFYVQGLTGSNRTRRRFFLADSIEMDVPVDFRIVAVCLDAAEQEGGQSAFSSVPDVLPVLDYAVSLDSETVPTRLYVDFADSKDDQSKYLSLQMNVLDAQGNELGKDQEWMYNGSSLSVVLFNAEPHQLELSITDIYGSVASQQIEITPEFDSVISDGDWTLVHTGHVMPEPGNSYIAADLASVAGRPAIATFGIPAGGEAEVHYMRAMDDSATTWPNAIAVSGIEGFDPEPDNTVTHVRLYGGSGSPSIALVDSYSQNSKQSGRIWFYGAADPDGSDFTAGQQINGFKDFMISQPDGLLRIVWGTNHGSRRFAIESASGSLAFDEIKMLGPGVTQLGLPQFLTSLQPGIVYLKEESFQQLAVFDCLSPFGSEVADEYLLQGWMIRERAYPLQAPDAVHFLALQHPANASDTLDRELVLNTVTRDGDGFALGLQSRQFPLMNRGFAKYRGINSDGYVDNPVCLIGEQPALFYTGQRNELMYVVADPGSLTGIDAAHRILLPAEVGDISPLDAISIEGRPGILVIDNDTQELLYISRD
ncbi:dockerin type I repeat-containing protein [bacterium]|nr:dockerin type I repeat-containing protein [bacterium]